MPKIVIVGAGAAGLAAAEELLRYLDIEIVILEQRGRIGGRACTDTTLLDSEGGKIPFDLGCHWIQNTENNPIAAISARIGETEPGYRFSPCKGEPGLRVWENGAENMPASDYYAEYDCEVAAALAAEFRLDGSNDYNASMLACLQQSAVPERRELLADRALPLYQLLEYSMEQGAECPWVLAADVLRAGGDLPGMGPDVAGDNAIVPAGLGALIERWGAEVLLNRAIKLQLNKPVDSIRENALESTYRVRAGETTIECDAVIVTVPTALLARENPRLERMDDEQKARLLRAFQALPLGNYKKVALQFLPDSLTRWVNESRRYLPNDFGPGANPTFIALIERADLAVLQTGGAPAYNLDRISGGEVAGLALDALCAMFGEELRASYTGNSIVTTWAAEPASGGAYAYTSPGPGAFQARRYLLDWMEDHTLLFAGEAIVELAAGTLHGAYWSGQRAGRALATTLGLIRRD